MRIDSGNARKAASLVWLMLAAPVATVRAGDFVNFESAHVHPVAMSPDATHLYVVNTPDNRLSVFDVAADGSLALDAEYVVGLEPASLAVRGNEVWVVNHLSDSLSIVDTGARRVVATIPTGDEPTDVVFAGDRAFVSMAGARDQVKVYGATTRAEIASIDIEGDDPRALAASADGSEVYLAVLESGNRTTTIDATRDGGELPPPSPPRSSGLPKPPSNTLIVQFNTASGFWEDEYGGVRGDLADLDEPDHDVFVIDASTLAVDRTIRSVGTTLFDLAVQPGSGRLFVANTDARNLVRFEPNLRGHLVDTRLTRVEPASGARSHFDLNPHIDYGVSPGPAQEIDASVSMPVDTQFTGDGSLCYVASFGSAKVAVVDPADGSIEGRIAVGGGPSGLALAETLGRLYVLNRFDQTVSIVDTSSRVELARVGIAGAASFDPSPQAVRDGRRLLYDATASSGHGDVSCASCHVFGNFDGLAWDLGDPTGQFVPYSEADWVVFSSSESTPGGGFHPMKGPMVTQTLRGLEDMEPFHWRGDRRDFQHFNGAFVSLLGRDEALPDADMDLFADFAMTIRMPPNPFRTLEDELPATVPVLQVSGFGARVDADPARGEDLFLNGLDEERTKNCVDCHAMPNGTDNTLNVSLLMRQAAKIAQLRNVYEKVGFSRFLLGELGNFGAAQQKSGFGVLHAGSISLTEFLFAYYLNDSVTSEDQQSVAAFVMTFPTGTPAVVGHQLGIDYVHARAPETDAGVARMLDQAVLGKADVVVHGVVAGQAKSFFYDAAANVFLPDSNAEPALGDVALRSSLEDGDVVTYMAVPAGSGRRIGIDRDRDTWRNADELVEGSDESDVESTPRECRGEDTGSLDPARLGVSIDKSDATRDLLTVRGTVDLTQHQSPAIDLVTAGMIFALRDANDELVARHRIAAGSLIEQNGSRWKLRRDAEPGVRRLSVRAKDGVFRFRLQVSVPQLSLDTRAFPLDLAAVIGDADQDAAGQCGRRAFERDDCEVSAEKSSCR
jgi:YVTN family beta-propeller protein